MEFLQYSDNLEWGKFREIDFYDYLKLLKESKNS